MLVDLFELLKVQGGLSFLAFCGPNGAICNHLQMYGFLYYSTYQLRGEQFQSPGIKRVAQAWVELQQGLMITYVKKFASGNKTFSFLEVWNKIVPEPHRSDLERALQLE